jgi:hypothetical protein
MPVISKLNPDAIAKLVSLSINGYCRGDPAAGKQWERGSPRHRPLELARLLWIRVCMHNCKVILCDKMPHSQQKFSAYNVCSRNFRHPIKGESHEKYR